MGAEQKGKTAEELAGKMREISVAEFFEKNRHLLGFDNPAKALLMVVKEACDNSLDAAEEARILPEIVVSIKQPAEVFRIINEEINEDVGKLTRVAGKVELAMGSDKAKFVEKKEPTKKETVYIFELAEQTYKFRVYTEMKDIDGKKVEQESYEFVRGRTALKIQKIPADRFVVTIEDNGPGIVKEHIPRVFGKLLYGSKFAGGKQGRGQQGIGICMTPDTLVPLSDGSVREIGWLVENNPEAEAFVLSPELKLVPIKIKNFWKIPAPPKLIRIKTLGGREIKLTPENPVLIRREMGLNWVRADEVMPGDFVAGARRVAVKSDKKLAVLDLLDQESLHADCPEFTASVIGILKKRHGSFSRLAEHYGLTKDIVRGWVRIDMRRRPTISIIKRMALEAGFSDETIIENVKRVGRMHHYTTIPKYVDRDLLYFAGLVAGDGNIQATRPNRWGQNISFWNNSKDMLEAFQQLSFKLFGVRGKIYKHTKGRGAGVQFSSVVVAGLLKSFGIPSGKKCSTFTLYQKIQTLPDDVVVGFIQGLFDAEGSVSLERRNIAFMILNPPMLKLLNMLLLRYGIFSNYVKHLNGGRLIITGVGNVKKFSQQIGFREPDQMARLNKVLQQMEQFKEQHSNTHLIPHLRHALQEAVEEIGITHYQLHYPEGVATVRAGCAITYSKLEKLCSSLLSHTKKIPTALQEMLTLLNADVTWLKITEKEWVDSPTPYVFDITMSLGNNFLANGLVVHNSAALLYAQLTTGKPAIILSRTGANKPVHYYELRIDTTKNEPIILEEKNLKEVPPLDSLKTVMAEHGIRVQLEIEGKYAQRYHGVEEYMKQSATVNPFAKFIYQGPSGETMEFKRVVNELPDLPKPIKPHPHGVEMGMLERMAKLTSAHSAAGFLSGDFCRVGGGTADDILKKSGVKPNIKPRELDHEQIEKIFRTIQSYQFMKPPLDCLSPIGEEKFIEGLKKEFKLDFVASVSRPPSVYRGNPFIIEVAIGYGGSLPTNEPAKIMRFANRVPLLYQAASCATTKAAQKVDWRNYGIEQHGHTPYGPVVIAIHMASVWIPYVTEAKEAIDPYPEIIKQIRLALQDCGRKVQRFISGKRRAHDYEQRQNLFEKYIPEAAEALAKLSDGEKNKIKLGLEKILKKGKVVVEEPLPEIADANGKGAEVIENGDGGEQKAEE